MRRVALCRLQADTSNNVSNQLQGEPPEKSEFRAINQRLIANLSTCRILTGRCIETTLQRYRLTGSAGADALGRELQ
jgi:hypothetical protein